MTVLLLVRDGEPIGYVDTEKAECEYNGDSVFVDTLITRQVGKNIGPPADNWNAPDQELKGDRLEEYIKILPDEFEEVDFDVVSEENFEGGRWPKKDS